MGLDLKTNCSQRVWLLRIRITTSTLHCGALPDGLGSCLPMKKQANQVFGACGHEISQRHLGTLPKSLRYSIWRVWATNMSLLDHMPYRYSTVCHFTGCLRPCVLLLL
ncbi:hypothetical protein LIA77_04181 [Sarocladium implicatum]|nr:hypothetical protein LIA77_04181 [Sarocladium implicatum]